MDDELGRHGDRASHDVETRREHPALEPRRTLARVPVGSRRRAHAAVAPRSPGRRRPQAHDLEERRGRLHVVTRRETPRAGRGGRGHHDAQDSAPHRDQPVSVQAGRGRLFGEGAAAPLRARRCLGDNHRPHLGGLRRAPARLVARRQIARIREQAPSRFRPRRQLGRVRNGCDTRCDAPAADDVRGSGQRSRNGEPTGLEPGRSLDCLPPRRSLEGAGGARRAFSRRASIAM